MGAAAVATQQGRRGAVSVFQPRADVILFKVEGFLDQPLASFIMKWSDQALDAVERLHTFHDWESVEGYEPVARAELTAYAEQRQDHRLGTHLLVRSQAVALGVGVANATLQGRMKAHGKRQSFEAALEAALATAPA